MKYKPSKHILIGIGLFLIVLVTAQAFVNFTFTDVILDKTPKEKNINYENISYRCDGEFMSVLDYEPDGKWDENDVQNAIVCDGIATNIKKEGVIYKENKYDKKSFDYLELSKDECIKDGGKWNAKKQECKS